MSWKVSYSSDILAVLYNIIEDTTCTSPLVYAPTELYYDFNAFFRVCKERASAQFSDRNAER
jgi:hypothetical protein